MGQPPAKLPEVFSPPPWAGAYRSGLGYVESDPYRIRWHLHGECVQVECPLLPCWVTGIGKAIRRLGVDAGAGKAYPRQPGYREQSSAEEVSAPSLLRPEARSAAYFKNPKTMMSMT